MRGDQAVRRSATRAAWTAQLEDRLEVRLLQRTTRLLGLTDDGREFLRSCIRILIAPDEAERVMRERAGTPAETLRVGLPTALRRLRIAPALDRLTARYPDLRVDASFSDQLSDLFEAGLDALVRISEPCDTRLIVRRFGTVRCIVCAAPSGLRRWPAAESHGPPPVRLCPPRTDRRPDWRGMEIRLA